MILKKDITLKEGNYTQKISLKEVDLIDSKRSSFTARYAGKL